ncbi:MAG: D-aminoacylase [Chloroflexi bacterium]|nr:D-aminoacylase [Chloroflexota bacterium]
MFDILIKDGQVIDGTGAPAYGADVAITGDRISAIGDIDADARATINASGKTVSPGFIDLHTHSDGSFLIDPLADSKVRQGVTLELMGNCGMSFCAPLRGMARDSLDQWLSRYEKPFEPSWQDMGGYLDALDNAGSTLNVAAQVGHGTVRQCVMAMDARAPTSDELKEMRRLVGESIDQGALGFATGLFYAPGSYSLTEEVIALVQVAAEKGVLYSSHLRSEGADGPGLFTAYQEALEIGRRTRVRVEISHVKCKGLPVWGRGHEILEMMERARREGLDVTGDQYPYTRSSTSITGALFPRWCLEGGRTKTLERMRDSKVRTELRAGIDETIREYGNADAVLIASFAPQPAYEGMNLSQIADRLECEPAEAALRLYEKGEGSVILASLDQKDVDLIAQAPFISVASDGTSLRAEGILGRGKPHPRSYGTNVRFLREFVREKRLVSLEEAIRRMTTLPASRLQLQRRGRIAPGYFADIVVFDRDTVGDTATFTDPHRYPTGVHDVFVNGTHVVSGGTPTGAKPGRVLRGANE